MPPADLYTRRSPVLAFSHLWAGRTPYSCYSWLTSVFPIPFHLLQRRNRFSKRSLLFWNTWCLFCLPDGTLTEQMLLRLSWSLLLAASVYCTQVWVSVLPSLGHITFPVYRLTYLPVSLFNALASKSTVLCGGAKSTVCWWGGAPWTVSRPDLWRRAAGPRIHALSGHRSQVISYMKLLSHSLGSSNASTHFVTKILK